MKLVAYPKQKRYQKVKRIKKKESAQILAIEYKFMPHQKMVRTFSTETKQQRTTNLDQTEKKPTDIF